MVRISLLVFIAGYAISMVDAQNAAVHAASIPVLESREATTPVAKATPSQAKPVPAPAKPAQAPAKPPATPGAASPKPPASPATPVKPDGAASGSVTPAASTKAGASLSAEKTWVTYQIQTSDEKACWRRAAFPKSKQCPAGFVYDEKAVCWAECPIEFPVQCGMECIRQNKDCMIHAAKHVTDVAAAAVKAATGGIFGTLTTAAKTVTRGVNCARQVFDVGSRIYQVLDDLSTTKQLTTREQLAKGVEQSDLVLYDLPLAIASCLGQEVSQAFNLTGTVVKAVKPVLLAIIEQKVTKQDIKNYLKFLDWFKKFTNKAPETPAPNDVAPPQLPPLTQKDVTDLSKAGNTCGTALKKYLKSVEIYVHEIMKSQPKIDIEYLQYVVLNSDIVTKDLPTAAQSCTPDNSPANLDTEDKIITAVQLIVDQILNSAFDPKGVLATIKTYKLTIARMALTGLEALAPVGIAGLISTLVQPICGPTKYRAAIADGPADKALGLQVIQKAFAGSVGTWKAVGDGKLKIAFKSMDKYNVTVNVYSGGTKVAKVEVPIGATVNWNQPLSALKGKTLYLDRTRPGILHLPGTGGGSLLVWVPDTSNGELTLTVPINKTKFFDKEAKAAPAPPKTPK